MKPIPLVRATQNLGGTSGAISFYVLLAIIALTAIPYGAVEPWWKAVFQCLVIFVFAFSFVANPFPTGLSRNDLRLLLPLLLLLVFAFLQTVTWSHYSSAGIDNLPRTISADPTQTRRFIAQFAALVLSGWLIVRHTNSQRRLQVVLDLIVLIGLLSAGFGLLRQATQHQDGFILPYLRPGFGYAQFINADHFAFLIEMAAGLALGVCAGRGVSRSRLAFYLLASIPMWLALILANSRGGILSMLCQIIFLAWLFVSPRIPTDQIDPQKKDWPVRKFTRTVRASALRILIIIVVLIAAVVAIIVIGGEPLARKLSAISTELDRKTANAYTLRLNIWEASRDLIRNHPVAGVGFGGYWIAVTNYHHAPGTITPQEAHSDYLESIASGGVIGLMIGLWFVFEVGRSIRRKLRDADSFNRAVTMGALVGIVTVAIHSLVDFGLHVTINALIVTVLASIAILRTTPESSRETIE